MITRRGLFRLLSGALASPALKPLAALVPSRFGGLVDGYDYRYGPQEVMRIWYDTHGNEMRELRKRVSMTKMCQRVDLPPRTGNQIKFWTYECK